MTVVPVVHGDQALRTALRRGLPPHVRVRACRSFAAVHTHLARDVVDAVVVRPRDHDWLREVAVLSADYPRIPVIACGPFRPDDARALERGAAHGVRALLVEGVDEPVAGALVAAETASHARERDLADAPRLLRLTEPIQRRAWAEVLARVGSRTTTAEIARVVQRTREHLSREFAAGGAPNLKRVIDLVRVVCAADLLANPGYTPPIVARVLRFSSPSHFTQTVRRVAGVAPAELARLTPRGVFQRFLRGRTRSRI